MLRIKLIVTGDMEKLALHKSLMRLFPSERNGDEVIWEKPRKLHCATSFRLRSLKENNGKCSAQMKELARAMFAETFHSKRKNGKPADLVIVIDDVEIGNLDQEYIIAEHFRAAIEQIIKEKQYSSNTEARYRWILREKCSFHLLKPMVESYLFGDANALRIAGVPDGVNPKLVHPTDVEQFKTDDSAWLPICRIENEKRQKVAPWWRHECHPKRYLEELVKRGGHEFYEETRHGKDALEKIAWKLVPKCQNDTPFIRSLFEDIADWFEFVIQYPFDPGTINSHFYPDRRVNRDTLLIRNI